MYEYILLRRTLFNEKQEDQGGQDHDPSDTRGSGPAPTVRGWRNWTRFPRDSQYVLRKTVETVVTVVVFGQVAYL